MTPGANPKARVIWLIEGIDSLESWGLPRGERGSRLGRPESKLLSTRSTLKISMRITSERQKNSVLCGIRRTTGRRDVLNSKILFLTGLVKTGLLYLAAALRRESNTGTRRLRR